MHESSTTGTAVGSETKTKQYPPRNREYSQFHNLLYKHKKVTHVTWANEQHISLLKLCFDDYFTIRTENKFPPLIPSSLSNQMVTVSNVKIKRVRFATTGWFKANPTKKFRVTLTDSVFVFLSFLFVRYLFLFLPLRNPKFPTKNGSKKYHRL